MDIAFPSYIINNVLEDFSSHRYETEETTHPTTLEASPDLISIQHLSHQIGTTTTSHVIIDDSFMKIIEEKKTSSKLNVPIHNEWLQPIKSQDMVGHFPTRQGPLSNIELDAMYLKQLGPLSSFAQQQATSTLSNADYQDIRLEHSKVVEEQRAKIAYEEGKRNVDDWLDNICDMS